MENVIPGLYASTPEPLGFGPSLVSPVRTRVSPDGPPEGGEVPNLTPAPPLHAPGVNAEDIVEIAQRLGV